MLVFADFYMDLYRRKPEADPTEFVKYMENIALGWLSLGQREYLLQSLTLDDIKEAIQKLPVGKAAGTDGLPGEFYKTYGSTGPCIIGSVMRRQMIVACCLPP